MNRIFKALIWGAAFLLAGAESIGLGFFIIAYRRDDLAQLFGWMSWGFFVCVGFSFAYIITRRGRDERNDIDDLIDNSERIAELDMLLLNSNRNGKKTKRAKATH